MLDDIHPIEILGINNSHLKRIQQAYPALRIVARGNEIVIQGDTASAADLEQKILRMMAYVGRNNKLSPQKLEEILGSTGNADVEDDPGARREEGFLLIGNDGQAIKAKTPNQVKLVEAAEQSDLLFAIGPAGTGKTYTSVAIAVRALKRKQVKRIIIARPAVEAGENLGFLPGDLKDKIDPYLRPVYDALDDMIAPERLRYFFENRIIEVAPLAFMRGRTLNHAYVILDEAQNATHSQLKMFLTRMGPDAKFIITGDLTQVDLPKKSSSGLLNALHMLRGIEGISIVELTPEDVIRHRLVKQIVQAYDKFQPGGGNVQPL